MNGIWRIFPLALGLVTKKKVPGLAIETKKEATVSALKAEKEAQCQ